MRVVDVIGVDLFFFEAGEDLFGAADDLLRHAGHLRDVDAVALVGGAGGQTVQEDHPIAFFKVYLCEPIGCKPREAAMPFALTAAYDAT